MSGKMERRTVYAITIVSLLAISASWAFAATFVNQSPPPQSSGITVVTPGNALETVQSTTLVTPSSELMGALSVAGTQNTGSGGSDAGTNAMINQCATSACADYFSAVDPTYAVVAEDAALQLVLNATQGQHATGFYVQVETVFTLPTSGSPATVYYAFGTGYFDTSTTLLSSGTSAISVFLYIGLGTPSTIPPSVSNVIVTINDCTTATTCP
ncbi:MAG TPA: hypothetical protein VEL82_07305 [Thermoplasmata archaeon]|nr:hypothetical protein [Thermoplasmata archaeon]